MKAMIFAAGLGSRLKPWTDKHPKALAQVNGKSLLERNILYLQQYGIKEVVVNVHHFASQIIEAIETNDGWGSTIFISDESDEVLETGGGLKKAAHFFKDYAIRPNDTATQANKCIGNIGSITKNHFKVFFVWRRQQIKRVEARRNRRSKACRP